MRIFEGFSRYRIDHLGSVYDTKLNRLLSQYCSSDGYLKVTLRSDTGERKGLYVHRLVALCYVPNTNNKPEVNHKDGIKRNTSYHNLEWVTHAENMQHAWDTGLIKSTEERSRKIAVRAQQFGAKNPNASAVTCLTTGEQFSTIKDAVAATGASQAQISKCCANKPGCKSAGKHKVTGEKLKWAFTKDINNE